MKTLTEKDIERISEAGKSADAVRFQHNKLLEANSLVCVQEPATLGNGIKDLPAQQAAQLQQRHDEAARHGRISSFIPASGSGTRLFKDLLQTYLTTRDAPDLFTSPAAQDDDSIVRSLKTLSRIDELAVGDVLQQRGCPLDDPLAVLKGLFEETEDGALPDLPKGLLPFHKYPNEIRTAFAEHLIEAGRLHNSRNKQCELHFTISRAHELLFENAKKEITEKLQQQTGISFNIDFSFQNPATDTVSIDSNGDLLRDSAGELEFRPGGHGSLLENLSNSSADIVLLKNIDNVSLEHYLADTLPVRKQLTGVLLQLEEKIHHLIKKLRNGNGVTEAFDLLENEFGYQLKNRFTDTDGTAAAGFALDRLNRPLRICGVVKNQGQAGGGPFWVDVKDYGRSLQIVESAQIDKNDPEQYEMLMNSTHFNPVILACSLRDIDGNSFDLGKYTDPDAIIITEKTRNGEPIKVIEHPGLWCGSMAKWNTVFVEIPAMLFNPVKVLSDLLNDYHCHTNFPEKE